MSYTRFNKRGVSQALSQAARGVLTDLAHIAAAAIARDAPRDSEFLAETVEAIGVGGKGVEGRMETRTSRKSGDRVERRSHTALALPTDTAAVHVAADYATLAEIRDPFIWPNIEALADELPGVVAKRRV